MDMIYTQFARCLVDVTRTAPQNTSVCFKQGSLIYDSRNLLSLTAIENKFDRVLWLDSDMTFMPDTLTRLMVRMDEGHDLVTGLYVKRTLPTKPVLFKRIDMPEQDATSIKPCFDDYIDYPRNAVFKIDGCGFGCVLTSVDLIKRIWDKHGPAFSPYRWAGEDIAFCYRAKLIGADMVCDSSIKCGHIGSVCYSEETYLAQGGDKH